MFQSDARVARPTKTTEPSRRVRYHISSLDPTGFDVRVCQLVKDHKFPRRSSGMGAMKRFVRVSRIGKRFEWDMPFLSFDQHHIHHMMHFWVSPAFWAATLNGVSLAQRRNELLTYFVRGTGRNTRHRLAGRSNGTACLAQLESFPQFVHESRAIFGGINQTGGSRYIAGRSGNSRRS